MSIKIKQRKAIKELLENGGNISRAMIKAGYSPNTAKNPQKLTKSASFQELISEYFPDEDLTKVHREGLMASKQIFRSNNKTGEIELAAEVPDFATRFKYLELGYKLKGYLRPDAEEFKKPDVMKVFTREQIVNIARGIIEDEDRENATTQKKSESIEEIKKALFPANTST